MCIKWVGPFKSITLKNYMYLHPDKLQLLENILESFFFMNYFSTPRVFELFFFNLLAIYKSMELEKFRTCEQA